LVATLDHPCQHRHDPNEQVLAFARGIQVEDSAPIEYVQNRGAFPRRTAGNLKEATPIRAGILPQPSAMFSAMD
jgi:hypothetical protein